MLSSSVRRGSDAAGFITGLFLAALPTALAFVVVGSVLRAPLPELARQVLAGLAALVFVLREFNVLKFPLLQNARLVPQFVAMTPFWGSVQFGAEMGTGMRTYSPTGLPHIMALCLLLLGSWSDALLAGTGFALGRALMLLTFLLARDKAAADKAFDFALPELKPLFVLASVPLVFVLVVLR
ncbi:hypothetical protein HS041_19520 [Planomonospora sp. ID67723]|uniref:hypothetical protein n=1 Tax=Planomonospora sp. ID67723 TaxID=2738134 RepID=UPI0018C3BE52|nr:hypothetical protein [Planomonospora sp. ID67723]MBG0829961.1 hypothetical protein [Planomonospora sp. ID67723]